MDDSQFERLIALLGKNDQRWELLVRIDENTKNMSRTFEEHKKDDHEFAALQKQSLEAVHRRVDGVKSEVGTTKDEIKKVRWMVLGAAILVSGVVYFTNFFFTIKNNLRPASIESPIRNT